MYWRKISHLSKLFKMSKNWKTWTPCYCLCQRNLSNLYMLLSNLKRPLSKTIFISHHIMCSLNMTFLGIWVLCLSSSSHWTSFLEQPHSVLSPMLVWYRILNIPTTCLVLVYNFVSPYNTGPSIAYYFELSY
jgi:hypothetical protein